MGSMFLSKPELWLCEAMLGSEEVRQRMLRGPVLLVLVNSCEQIFIEMLLLYAVIDATVE